MVRLLSTSAGTILQLVTLGGLSVCPTKWSNLLQVKAKVFYNDSFIVPLHFGGHGRENAKIVFG